MYSQLHTNKKAGEPVAECTKVQIVENAFIAGKQGTGKRTAQMLMGRQYTLGAEIISKSQDQRLHGQTEKGIVMKK
jgi:hypothetical protein